MYSLEIGATIESIEKNLSSALSLKKKNPLFFHNPALKGFSSLAS